MKSIGKRKFIVLIVGFAVMVILLWVILLTVILGNDDDSGSSSKKSSKKTKTEKVVEADQQEEKENREKDENMDEDMAEEIRHAAEISTAEKVIYDEILALVVDSDSYVAILSVGEGGLKWEKDVPELASAFKDIFGDHLDKFSWLSEKYKGQRYTVFYKRPDEGTLAMSVIGKWGGEE